MGNLGMVSFLFLSITGWKHITFGLKSLKLVGLEHIYC